MSTNSLGSTSRAIYRIQADIPDVALGAGDYTLTWALAPSFVFSGSFVPPVLGSLGTGNAEQSRLGGAFAAVSDSTSHQPFDLPFTVNGTLPAVPEAPAWALWLAGGLALARRVRRRST